MRIVRYALEIVDYQQLQPLWPGRILSVGLSKEVHADGVSPMIDMWCTDNDAKRGDRRPPILGVWILGTGQAFDPDMIEADALFHGTVDIRHGHKQHDGFGAWHVWSAVVGEVPDVQPLGELSSIDDLVSKIKARHESRRT